MAGTKVRACPQPATLPSFSRRVCVSLFQRAAGLMAQELQLKMQQVPAFSRTDAPEHAGDLQGAATRDGSG